MIRIGDLATLDSGQTGVVTELWGDARLFARIRLESGKTLPVMASSIINYQRPAPKWGGEPREKRKKANAQAEASAELRKLEP